MTGKKQTAVSLASVLAVDGETRLRQRVVLLVRRTAPAEPWGTRRRDMKKHRPCMGTSEKYGGVLWAHGGIPDALGLGAEGDVRRSGEGGQADAAP